MNIEYFEIKKMPVLLIDDFFTEEEEDQILSELVDLRNEFSDDPAVNQSASKLNDEGVREYSKNATGFFLDTFYRDEREKSSILKINRKLFDNDLIQQFKKYHYFFHYIESSTKDTTAVHYYENDNYYKFHTDSAVITALSWHYFEPKRFSNGNLFLDQEEEIRVECIRKRIIIFPSIIEHAVEEVVMKEEYQNKNLGRYSMAQFIYFN